MARAASVKVRALNFGAWFSFDDAPAAAPELPGVLQARAEFPLAYPKGKSAMLLYACTRADETLRHYVAARGATSLIRARENGGRWVRFGTSPRPGEDCERLLERFMARFGAAPAANRDSAQEDEEARSFDG